MFWLNFNYLLVHRINLISEILEFKDRNCVLAIKVLATVDGLDAVDNMDTAIMVVYFLIDMLYLDSYLFNGVVDYRFGNQKVPHYSSYHEDND